MAKKPPKRQFDWKTHSRPARRLSDLQEHAFRAGVLTPLLGFCQASGDVSLQLRSHAAGVYRRGVLLLRLSGEGPFVAEFEPIADRPAERRVLETASDVEEATHELERRQSAVDSRHNAGARSKRDYLQAIAAANAGAGSGLFGGAYLIVDMEYPAGKRRFDLVGLRRTEGVTGPGGYANPRLALFDVRFGSQSLTGPNGLEAVGADLAEFAKALGGSHLERAKAEIEELVAQKVRLGLLPAELELRALDAGLPEFVVVFAEYDGLDDPRNDTAIAGLHDRLVARHFPPERLRLVDLPSVPSAPELGTDTALLDADAALDYRQFKAHRTRGRG